MSTITPSATASAPAGRSVRLRPCPAEAATTLAIINAAAEAYRGVIPADCWHDPYMRAESLETEMRAGVVFWGAEVDGVLAGVMGVQAVQDVDLIRHAYVSPVHQGRGLGGALLGHLVGLSRRPMLVGAWAAAIWAIRFYERHGFQSTPETDTAALLRKYWRVSDRQIETSVVLALKSTN